VARGSVKAIQRKGKDGKPYQVWRARVPAGETGDGKRRQLTKVLRTRKEADAWVNEQLAGGVRVPERMMVGELLDRWLTLHEREVRGSSAKVDRWAAKIVREHIGALEVSKLSVLRVQGFYDGIEGHYAPSSVSMIHRVLRSALQQAVAWEVISRNPAIGTRRPPRVAVRQTAAWTPEEAGAFLAATRDDLDGPLWAVLLSTGLRINEALALDWRHVSADGATITVTRTMTRDADNRPVMGTAAKSRSSHRKIALPLMAQAALVRQRKAQEARGVAGGAVFDDGTGSRRTDTDARKTLYAAVEALGLPRMTLHGLRHSCASILARRGVPAHRIKELLGHSSVAITMDIYAHVLEQDRADTAAEMDRVFGESVSGGEERELGVR
jgi:integrase